MIECNVYIVDLDINKEAYLYTTLADSVIDATKAIDTKFYKEAAGVEKATFHVLKTEDDDRSRDDLIFDYIIEKDDSTGAASGK